MEMNEMNKGPGVYPMPAEKLGCAYVLNWLPDMKQTREDYNTLKSGFKAIGLKVFDKAIKNKEELTETRKRIVQRDYSAFNLVFLAIIAHGDAQGRLWGEHKEKNTRRKEEFSCNFQDLRSDLDRVESLVGKPKLVVLQACRGEGGTYSRTVTSPLRQFFPLLGYFLLSCLSYSLSRFFTDFVLCSVVSIPLICVLCSWFIGKVSRQDEGLFLGPGIEGRSADFGILYATTPGYGSYTGPSRGEDGSRTPGSPFITTFMKHMLQKYKTHNVRDIYHYVRTDMSTQVHQEYVKGKPVDIFQVPEEQISLTKNLSFFEYLKPKFVRISKVKEVGLHEDDRFKFHELIEVKSTKEILLIGTEPVMSIEEVPESKLSCIRNVTGTKKNTWPVCCRRSMTDFVYSEIEAKLYLIMNCFDCGMKLLDLKKMKMQTACDWKGIAQMCEGQNNTLFVEKNNRIIQLDCSTTRFKLKPGFGPVTVKFHSRFCYIRSTNILIVSEPSDDLTIRVKVHAISCESGQILWSVMHNDLMFVQDLPKYNGILGVYQSSAQSQIQIICPKTGLCAQQISLTTIGYPIGMVSDILICNGRLFILGDSHTSSDQTSKVFIYSV